MYAVARALLLPFLKMFFRWRLLGVENIPKSGPVIVACNHISYFDPLCHAYMIDRSGRKCRFFAKAELWKNPFLRFVLTHAHQIPVERGSGETGPVEKAIEWLRRGELVVIYPEATITTNPDLTPMSGKTGVGRVALATGAPVVPIAVWGSHWVRPKRRKRSNRIRRLMMLKAAGPMRFDDLAGHDEAEAAREVTDRVTGELDRLVRELHKIHPDGGAVPELIGEDG
ncbi:MAG TPA: lysophospholipid acyltransferase family protein [Actinomycetota bacterium]|nr:lysophospholipid acyltransferase family protein [Actinomycetota bacterium]